MRWLRIAISFTVTLLTLLCMLPALAAQGSGWSVLLDDQGNLQLSDIRSARYTNQFSPIELDRLTAAEPDGALWLRFKLAPGKHEQLLRVFAPDLSHLHLYVLDGDTLIEQLPIAFGAVATDLYTGEEVWLREGPMMRVVRASSGVPGLFAPAWHAGRWLIDGGVVNQIM